MSENTKKGHPNPESVLSSERMETLRLRQQIHAQVGWVVYLSEDALLIITETPEGVILLKEPLESLD